MRRDDFLDQMAQAQLAHRPEARLVERGQFAQNDAAAVDFLAQQAQVVGKSAGRRAQPGHFRDRRRNGGQGRSEFVGGGGGQAIELRQMLFARQHEFGGGQRAGQLARLLGDPIGVDRDKHRPGRERHPGADAVKRRQLQRLAAPPRQRLVGERQRRAQSQRQDEQGKDAGRRQRGRRYHHRREDEDRERVGQPACQVKQCRELNDIEAKDDRRPAIIKPVTDRKPPAQSNVDQRGGCDAGKAQGQRQGEAKNEMRRQHRRRLAQDGHPAQAIERADAQLARLAAEIVVINPGHRRTILAVPGERSRLAYSSFSLG